MDTVSYLTINDETKEIADIDSRNDIEDIKSILAAYRTDIDNVQFDISENGPIYNHIRDAKSTAIDAQVSAATAADAANTAINQAESANNAANFAWNQASSAMNAADIAQEKAIESSRSAGIAEAEAAKATSFATSAHEQSIIATEYAEEAKEQANVATEYANEAKEEANIAHNAALSAQGDAVRANSFANGALAGMSTLESVIDTVKWFADHRTLSTDTIVDNNKNYYILDEETGTMSKVDPVGVENPAEENWYEIDETIQNYVVSHVAQTNDGLSILSTAENWRIVISTGTGRYVPGIFIISPEGVIKQQLTGDGISFDKTSPFYLGDDNAYILFEPPYKNSYGNDSKGHIKIVATNNGTIDISGQVNIGGTGKTLTEALEDIGQSINTIEYGKSSSNTSHADVLIWSPETPEWENDKYIWMRTKTIDGTYTYTCIQGAQGPQGETGARGEAGTTGERGVGKESVEVSYGVTDYEDEVPENITWVQDMDTLGQIEQGKWFWVRTITNYTDLTSEATYQKSYVGTDGNDAIRVEIDPIGGNFIRRGQTGISLIAHVYEGINDITNQFSHFTWYRRKADGTRDTSWSTEETSNQLYITTADIDESVVFVCEVTVTR